jgi:hypothetical protein
MSTYSSSTSTLLALQQQESATILITLGQFPTVPERVPRHLGPKNEKKCIALLVSLRTFLRQLLFGENLREMTDVTDRNCDSADKQKHYHSKFQ